MVKIEVENIVAHMSSDHEVSRVPCIGEQIMVGDGFFEVVQVFHYTDVDPNEKRVAIIRVR
jgi:hypothetical protein